MRSPSSKSEDGVGGAAPGGESKLARTAVAVVGGDVQGLTRVGEPARLVSGGVVRRCDGATTEITTTFAIGDRSASSISMIALHPPALVDGSRVSGQEVVKSGDVVYEV